MKSFLKDLPTVTLRPSPPPVVRHSFFVVDNSPDHKPAWVIPSRLAVGSQDCAFSEETRATFTHIVNVGFDIPNAFPDETNIKYFKTDVSDLGEFVLFDVFEQVSAFLDEAFRKGSSKALIHCQAGVSRSITIAAAYIMLVRARRGQNPSADEVLKEIRTVRSAANPNAGFQAQLRDYERLLVVKYPASIKDANEHKILMEIRRVTSMNDMAKRRGTFGGLKIQLQRMIGRLIFVYHVVRPGATAVSLLALTWRGIHGRLSKTHLILTLLMAWGLSQDDVFRANVFERLAKGAKPGLYATERMKNTLVNKMPSLQREYAVPRWLQLLGGDFTTISFLLLGFVAPLLEFTREEVVTRALENDSQKKFDDRRFSLDWAFPRKQDTLAQDCCLMLSGIGGNSESAYVRDVADQLLSDGLVVAVLLARGLGICSHVEDLDRLYDPTDDEDVHLAVTRLSAMYRRVVVVGFSLGGVTACRYFSNFAPQIPSNVKGCVSISGAFKVRFISNPRYENVYQQVLVPSLVDDIVSKYGDELERRLGSLHPVLSCTSYRDIHRELYTNAKIPGVATDFGQWRDKMEACPSKVTRPLLLITALDDPLHHPECLGLNKLWDGASTEDTTPSENVIVVCTNGGGHVAWPEDGFGSKGYSYLRRLTSEFFTAVLEAD